MTSKQKEHEKALKGPDQFQVQVMTGMDWAVKHAKLILAVAVPLVCVAGGLLIFQKMQGSRRDGRLEELGKVQIVYENEARKANDQREVIQKQVQSIDAKQQPAKPKAGDTAPAAPLTPDPKLVAEKAALEKQAEAIKPDHAESTKLFQEFFKKYEQTPEGWMAGMTAAKMMIDAGKIADATPVLETVLTHSKDYPFYQTQAGLTLVSVLEEQGNYDKALAQLDQLDKTVDAELKPKVLLARGRIQLLKNQKPEAKVTFDSLIEKHAASPEAQKARSMQALFN